MSTMRDPARDPRRGDVLPLPDGRTVRVDFVEKQGIYCATHRNGTFVSASIIPWDAWPRFLGRSSEDGPVSP